MKTENFNVIVLKPEEGFYLTQASVSEDEEQMFWEKIYLGVNDSEENYKEISVEDAKKIMESQKKDKEENK